MINNMNSNQHPNKKEKSLKDVIDSMFNKYRLTQKMNEVKLVNSWSQMVGPLISKHTSQLLLRGKTLYVTFDNAALKSEMNYRKDALLEAINREMGEGIVEKIIVR